MTDKTADKYIGKKLDGRYQVEDLIGVGGMSYVYKATDLKTGDTVAVKILKDEFSNVSDLVSECLTMTTSSRYWMSISLMLFSISSWNIWRALHLKDI